jgi:dethiobiotin synthetase
MRLGEGVFVTGTGTGVGKSVVTAALGAALWQAGVRVRAIKPVASGVPVGSAGEDAELLGLGAGHPPAGAFRLRAPLSPHRAAALEGASIEPDAVIGWIHDQRGEVTLVEGAGGWHVPITPRWRVSDLAQALGWPVLVVAADQLGVLNLVLLTVEAVRARGLTVAGVVLVEQESPDEAASYNAEDLRALLPDVPVRRMPRLGSMDVGALALAGRGVLRDG